MKSEKVNLQLSVEEARDIYPNAPESVKLMLEKNFGKSALVLDICKRVTNLEDSYNETGRPKSFRDALEKDQAFMQSVYDAMNFTEALNEGEKIDIYDSNKRRHYPWFYPNGSPAGFRFDGSYYDNACADAGSGSRLSFKEERLSNHAAKCIPEVYRTMLDS